MVGSSVDKPNRQIFDYPTAKEKKKKSSVQLELGASERDRVFYGLHSDYDRGL